MNILVTNDDGVNASGINSLYNVISKKFNTYMIAPDSQRSACSNAITVHSDIKVKKISERIFSISGYPADCVNLGLHADIMPEIDIVVSGINHGPNAGDDVFFSGTVAAARSAYIFGKTGIAVSMDCYTDTEYFEDAAEFVLNFIEMIKTGMAKKAMFFSINYPNLSPDEIKGVKYTFLGKRSYHDHYVVEDAGDGILSYQLHGIVSSEDIGGSDLTELKNGYITITPLGNDITDYYYLNSIRRE